MKMSAKYGAILTGIVVIIAAGFALFGSPAKQTADTGVGIVAVSMPSLSSTAKTGQKLFIANCALCHGTNADGRDGKGPPLITRFMSQVITAMLHFSLLR